MSRSAEVALISVWLVSNPDKAHNSSKALAGDRPGALVHTAARPGPQMTEIHRTPRNAEFT